MNASHVILGPVITEKAVQIAEKNNQHTLYIHTDATKDDVKNALKKFFGVEADSIKIVKLHHKIRVRSKYGPQVKRKQRKKAIVCLKEGKSFDLLKLAPAPKAPKASQKNAKTAKDTTSVTQ